MIMPLERPKKMNRTELMIAVIALLLLLAVRPALAQTVPATAQQTATQPSTTTGTTAPGGSLNPAMTGTTQTNSSQTGYLNVPNGTQPITPGSSQSQREANAFQQGTGTNQQLQTLPECRAEDTSCIEQRNRLNQTNPQTAPTFNR